MYINGKFIDSISDKKIPIHNPVRVLQCTSSFSASQSSLLSLLAGYK
jgi:hypothetical protein